MTQPHPAASAEAAATATRERTGIVVPVYLPPSEDRATGVELLADNLSACAAAVSDPTAICLAVDGRDCGFEAASELAQRFGTSITVSPVNKGKLHALRHGMKHTWARADVDWFAVIDSDGDHFANELVNLVRAALNARQRYDEAEVCVIGRRISRHRPMGLLRGELEELADRVLLDALAYHGAIANRPLPLTLTTTMEEYPDFHSGFKVFSRAATEAVFLRPPALCGVPETAYFRHGCESVMTVEAVRAGAQLVLVNRTTLNEQPVSTFGRLDRERLVADKIVWPCRRLGVPQAFLDQWLRNHIPRLLLNTLVPDGKRELVAIRELIAADCGLPPVDAAELTAGPLFL